MAWQQIHLSKREQWAQNLNGNLVGMIPFAEYLAIYFDNCDQDDLDHFLFELLESQPRKGREVWEQAFKIIRDWKKNIGKEKDFDSALKTSRRWYSDIVEFTAAKKQVIITFLMNEFSPNGKWSD